MDTDAESVTRLTENPTEDQYPTWSPDGQQIAFSSVQEGNYEIFVMNADGSDLTQVTHDPTDNAWDDTYPTWSPNNFTFSEEPWFGPPFIARDTDGDFQPDNLDPRVSIEDFVLFIGFPFRNMENGMAWNMEINLGGMVMNNILFWEDGNSGVYFKNIPFFSPSPSDASIQLIVDEKVLQEITFEIVEP
jgi:dipeptidyl aminopeptidase/acylaminoacyl peptidase